MIALHAKDRFGLLAASGMVCLLALQAAVNIGVTTSLLPNKGLPLPFISYGGRISLPAYSALDFYSTFIGKPFWNRPTKNALHSKVRLTPRINWKINNHQNERVIACGGTGWASFSGIASAEVLRERGHEVLLFVSEKEIRQSAAFRPIAVPV